MKALLWLFCGLLLAFISSWLIYSSFTQVPLPVIEMVASPSWAGLYVIGTVVSVALILTSIVKIAARD